SADPTLVSGSAMSRFISEDDLKNFEGWLRYQGYDSMPIERPMFPPRVESAHAFYRANQHQLVGHFPLAAWPQCAKVCRRARRSRKPEATMNFIRLAFLALTLLEAGHASAQTYPDHTVRILVGFTPGSATDVSARMFAQKLSDAWAVPVTIENLPGGGGSIG